MSVIEHIVSTIAPHQCLGCGEEGSLLCKSCSAGLTSIPERCYRCLRSNPNYTTCKNCRTGSVLHRVEAATTYQASAKELVHALKFERAKAAASVMANLMAERIAIPEQIIVTHVPTATSRARARGYDQAALIAKELARQLNLVYTPLLTRLGQERQVGKNRAERQKQMRELFMATQKHVPKQVLLVDDVVTTGATLEACARVLKEAGVKRIEAAVFAAA